MFPFIRANSRPIFLLSLFLILLGSRAALIRYAGNSTPFMDEWDGDAALLIKPYFEGRLSVSDIFAPLNEHRIVFTRLLVLSILKVSGYWDVVLQMIVNAILELTTIVAISYGLARVLSKGWAPAAMIACVIMNAVPYGYDNVLLGFNTHFYLLNAFSFASLWLMTGERAWSVRWAAGAVVAVASYFCMASGALTLAAVCGVHLLQAAVGRRSGVREATGIAALAVATFVLLRLIPHVEASEAFRAHSIGQFLSALAELAFWPATTALGTVLLVPSALFVLRVAIDRPAATDPRWVNVAALLWVLAQVLALAVGRAQWAIQSRYTGVLLIGLMIDLISAFWIFQSYAIGDRPAVWRRITLAAWLAVFVLSLTHPQRHLRSAIDERRDIAIAEAKNLRSYLATGDASYLAGPSALQIPYFDSGRLRELLDTPSIGAALPPDLTGATPPSRGVEAVKDTVLRLGLLWLGLGVVSLIVVLSVRSPSSAESFKYAARRSSGDAASSL